MGMDTVAAGIKGVVNLADGFASAGKNKNITIGDWDILDRGVTKAVVIEYDPSDHGQSGSRAVTHGNHVSIHVFMVRVFRQYEKGGTSYENLLADTNTVLTKLNQYPKLNGTSNVLKAEANRTGTVLAMMTSGEGPYFLQLPITLIIHEEVAANSQE